MNLRNRPYEVYRFDCWGQYRSLWLDNNPTNNGGGSESDKTNINLNIKVDCD